MIEIAKKHRLCVCDKDDKFIYLTQPNTKISSIVHLDITEIPADKIDDELFDVFVYPNSNNDLMGTLKTPLIELGQIATLKISHITDFGAFLDWGLPKELFLPISEQIYPLSKGQTIIVGLKLDKQNRPCATMKFRKMFKLDAPFYKDDIVDVIVYRINPDFGAFVVVENQYEGLLLKSSYSEHLKVNDLIDARVTRVREDGRIDLSRLPKKTERMDSDVKTIWTALGDNAGRLPLNDYSSPEDIKHELNMSKKAFKRAVGRLLKNGKIRITDDGIEML